MVIFAWVKWLMLRDTSYLEENRQKNVAVSELIEEALYVDGSEVGLSTSTGERGKVV